MNLLYFRVALGALCLGRCLVAAPAAAQKLFQVQNFSPRYYGKVWVEQPGEVFSPGWVAIYEKSSGKELIKVDAEELAVDLENGKIKTNVHELPYGEQSVIIYEDFNFDGVNDFAIEDGQNSCYHGPSFRIYLAQGKSFALSEEFTDLAQNYCGMFSIDRAHKTISTMTKDGCCWHEYSEFAVRNGNLVPLSVVEVDQWHQPFSTITTTTWQGKKKATKFETELELSVEGTRIFFSFDLASNGKKMVLFSYNERTLQYALVKSDGRVEFTYPLLNSEGPENDNFIFSAANPTKTLEFRNGDVRYRIYQTASDGKAPEKTGIEVSTNGKTYDLVGKVASKRGSLTRLGNLHLKNLVRK